MVPPATTSMPLLHLVSAFIKAYATGALRGRAPGPDSIKLAIHLALGEARGLVAYAVAAGIDRFDEACALRWLEARAPNDAASTIRHCVNLVRRLAEYGVQIGVVSEATRKTLAAIRPPPTVKGRVHEEGVPTDVEVDAIIDALRPRRRDGAPYDAVAELQLRLGLRPSEVIALREDWLDEAAGCVYVLASAEFRPKDFESRTIDGVDAATFALARHVIALRNEYRITRTGYKQAWRRAVRRMRGQSWRYRAKGQSLRAVNATVSRTRGIPLSVVARRLGHSSERTTERSYIGVQRNVHRGPYEGVPVRSSRGRESA